MWKKLSAHKGGLALLAGLSMVLAFSPIHAVPCVFLLPLFSTQLVRRANGFKDGLKWGFLVSFVLMLGGFYWVTYVIHEFGYLPWAVAALLYLGFCGFGALNLTFYVAVAAELHRRFSPDSASPLARDLWYVLGLPALFTILEFFIPKLFPWYVGHSFAYVPWVNQIAEITGGEGLTFLVFSLGGAMWLAIDSRRFQASSLPLLGFALAIGFSLWRLSEPAPPGHMVRVALIQANIGSLEKAAARKGSVSIVEHVIDRYTELTEQALKTAPKPQLIVWPETALPFSLEPDGAWQFRVRNKVVEWNVPLLTGGYADSPLLWRQDYNAAFLLTPLPDGRLDYQIYKKNILLAFGEYFPGGETFPGVYRLVPQVSHFARGMTQEPLKLPGGTKVGITICYEAIVPDFFRKSVAHGLQLMINLTNDSWFGPTSEPRQHGALAVFRSIEHRLSLVRVTNTGISYVADRWGRVRRTTPVYDEGVLVEDVFVPDTPTFSIYQRFGDWFIGACLALLGACLLFVRRSRAPVSA